MLELEPTTTAAAEAWGPEAPSLAPGGAPPAPARRGLPILLDRAPGPPVASPRSVRLSITDRCDFACVYCRPSRNDGYAETRITPEEWQTVVDGLLEAGVRRFRITGGEPLIHPQVLAIVAYIAGRGVEDLALTTNASQLAKLAGPLRAAGLRRLNISIDSLDAKRFARLTRGGRLAPVLAGIEAAIASGFDEIKLNAVVLRGQNDDELESLTRYAWERRMVPRFLEVMAIGEGARLLSGELADAPGGPSQLVTAVEMRARLAHLLEDETPVVEPDRGPARYVRARHDRRLRVGFITGTSDTYCGTCDRLRVSSTGVLRPCLATEDGVDARAVAERGDSAGLVQLVGEAWAKKPDGRTFKGCTEDSAKNVSMRAIGG